MIFKTIFEFKYLVEIQLSIKECPQTILIFIQPNKTSKIDQQPTTKKNENWKILFITSKMFYKMFFLNIYVFSYLNTIILGHYHNTIGKNCTNIAHENNLNFMFSHWTHINHSFYTLTLSSGTTERRHLHLHNKAKFQQIFS